MHDVEAVDTEIGFKEVVETLTLAFTDDPIARWLHGGSAGAHLRDFPEIMRVLGRDCFNAGGVTRSVDGRGVALWLPPGGSTDDAEMDKIFPEVVPEHRREEAGRLFAWAHENAPQRPFWYLSLIGVDPLHKGRGVGSILMSDALRRVDAQGTESYLWSSNPRNIPFYERFGFEAVSTETFGSSPPVTAMLRPPR